MAVQCSANIRYEEHGTRHIYIANVVVVKVSAKKPRCFTALHATLEALINIFGDVTRVYI